MPNEEVAADDCEPDDGYHAYLSMSVHDHPGLLAIVSREIRAELGTINPFSTLTCGQAHAVWRRIVETMPVDQVPWALIEDVLGTLQDEAGFEGARNGTVWRRPTGQPRQIGNIGNLTESEMGFRCGVRWAWQVAGSDELRMFARWAELDDWTSVEAHRTDDGTLFAELQARSCTWNTNRIVWPRDPFMEGFVQGAVNVYNDAIEIEGGSGDEVSPDT